MLILGSVVPAAQAGEQEGSECVDEKENQDNKWVTTDNTKIVCLSKGCILEGKWVLAAPIEVLNASGVVNVGEAAVLRQGKVGQ